ncbi:MAG TPA: MBL fold metallo-hydrolase [Bryobacteraceae bacterium]|jgi:glyoxylase-like metal-dependent hydrolase (beta-lactamase superfamily II)|nr:MBL fold metallo-hydrolase [Bryobacteraceae bacterium]
MRLSDRCFAVTGLAYLPPWSVNAGFVAGDHTTLIVDTGANALAAATIHGYASSVRGGNGVIAIDTERHFDHIGGNGYFRERGVDVYGHASIHRTEDEFRVEIAEFNAAIPDVARRRLGESEVFYRGTVLANPNRPLRDGTTLDLGGCSAEIILTPGHTPSNLSVYVPDDGVLFCGDCLINGYVPNLDCGMQSDWQVWLESLDRLGRLDLHAVVPGHGPVATGDAVPVLIDNVRRELERAIATGISPTAASKF